MLEEDVQDFFRKCTVPVQLVAYIKIQIAQNVIELVAHPDLLKPILTWAHGTAIFKIQS